MTKELQYTKTPNDTNPLSFSTLRNILNGATSGETSLGQYYKGSFNVPNAFINNSVPTSGAISFSDLRGRLSRITCRITGTETNIQTGTLFNLDGTNEYGGALRKEVFVDGATVVSDNLNTPAFNVTAGLGGTAMTVNVGAQGKIYGKNGAGGPGGAQGTIGGSGQAGGPSFVNNSSKSIYVQGGGTVKGGAGGGGGGGGGGKQGSAGRNSYDQCDGWFCPSPRQVCGRGVGGGNQAGGSGGSAGAGMPPTNPYLEGQAGQAGQGPRGGAGGAGGIVGGAGQNGQAGGQGPTGPGGNCQGGGAGQAGGGEGPAGATGSDFQGGGIVVASTIIKNY